MKKALIFILGAVCCVLALEIGLRTLNAVRMSRHGGAPAVSRPEAPGTKRIICFGCSMTESAYPAFLEKALNRKSKTSRFMVIDKGLSITGTDYILSILDACLDRYDPWMIVVMSGIHDTDELARRQAAENDAAPGPSAGTKRLSLRDLRVVRLCILLSREIKFKLLEMNIFRNCPGELKSAFSQDCVLRAQRCMDQKKYDAAEKLLERAIGISPDDYALYWQMDQLYCVFDPEKGERWLLGLIRSHPDVPEFRQILAEHYVSMQKYPEAASSGEKAYALDPSNSNTILFLLELYHRSGNDAASERLLRKLPEIGNPGDRLYGAIAVRYLEEGNRLKADRYFSLAEETRAEEARENAAYRTTAGNYRKIAEKAAARNVKLVCMQYPMRPAAPLRNMLAQYKGAIVVDNEKLFKDAVMNGRFDDVFSDRFAGDFGHCTPKGNELIAEHLADEILKHEGDRTP